MNSNNTHPSPEIPRSFTPDWHHQLGESLSVFPRQLILPLEGEHTQFWPDLATLIDDPDCRALMYYPGVSRFSVCVVYRHRQWEIIKFDDDSAVARAAGQSYREAMIAALSLGTT